MQHLKVSVAVRPLKWLLGVKWLRNQPQCRGSCFSLSRDISHHITTIPTSHSYLNLWRRIFWSRFENRWKFLGYEFSWYGHSQCRRFCYKIIRQV